MGQAGQFRIGSMWVEPTEQQAHLVPRLERSAQLQHRALAAAQGVGVAMSQDDVHLVSSTR
jgi:hypothetical protein